MATRCFGGGWEEDSSVQNGAGSCLLSGAPSCPSLKGLCDRELPQGLEWFERQ